MPSNVATIMAAVGLTSAGTVPWRTPVPLREPGVYVVAMTDSEFDTEGHSECPISSSAVAELLHARPELLLDGNRPTSSQLEQRIASMWLPDETILYIGLAGSSVFKRVDQYYRTPLGARSPHSGGWPLKTLATIERLWVHFAPCPNSDAAERNMLAAFMANVSSSTRQVLHDSNTPLPFANLTTLGGPRKKHGITGAREPRQPQTGPQKAASAMIATANQYFTQRVTQSDVDAGRIRVPASTKPILPQDKRLIDVVLRGRALQARWDPRNGPDRPRSGVISIGRHQLAAVVHADEYLALTVRQDGCVELS